MNLNVKLVSKLAYLTTLKSCLWATEHHNDFGQEIRQGVKKRESGIKLSIYCPFQCWIHPLPCTQDFSTVGEDLSVIKLWWAHRACSTRIRLCNLCYQSPYLFRIHPESSTRWVRAVLSARAIRNTTKMQLHHSRIAKLAIKCILTHQLAGLEASTTVNRSINTVNSTELGRWIVKTSENNKQVSPVHLECGVITFRV